MLSHLARLPHCAELVSPLRQSSGVYLHMVIVRWALTSQQYALRGARYLMDRIGITERRRSRLIPHSRRMNDLRVHPALFAWCLAGLNPSHRFFVCNFSFFPKGSFGEARLRAPYQGVVLIAGVNDPVIKLLSAMSVWNFRSRSPSYCEESVLFE